MLMEVARLGITGARRTKIQARKLLMSTMLVASVSVHAATLSGTVVGVSDGDTITVLDANREQHKIRVAGIDAPEKAQPFGQRSKGLCRCWWAGHAFRQSSTQSASSRSSSSSWSSGTLMRFRFMHS